MGYKKSAGVFTVIICCYIIMKCQPALAQQQVHPQSSTYEWPKEEKVKQQLDKWQDQKFGMIIHWGFTRCRALLNRGIMFGRLD